MAEKRERVFLEIDAATKSLVDNLMAAGVGHSPTEIVARAVKSFFVATYPRRYDWFKSCANQKNVIHRSLVSAAICL